MRYAWIAAIVACLTGVALAGPITSTCDDTAAVVRQARISLVPNLPDGGISASIYWCGAARKTQDGGTCEEHCTDPILLNGGRRTQALSILDAGRPEYIQAAGFPP